ncbi:MAG: hypothetical protein ACI9QL_000001 [Candidatus Omnitrophota bacterium]
MTGAMNVSEIWSAANVQAAFEPLLIVQPGVDDPLDDQIISSTDLPLDLGYAKLVSYAIDSLITYRAFFLRIEAEWTRKLGLHYNAQANEAISTCL